MKNKIKGFILGFIVATLLVGNMALATDGSISINVLLNNINLIVNGKKVDADTILYNETTYVPLRKVAQMLGKKVGWNGDTNTASINDKNYIEINNMGENKLNDLGVEFAIKIGDKYYILSNGNERLGYMSINNNGQLYIQEYRYFVLCFMTYLLSHSYTIEECDNPNLDGIIILQNEPNDIVQLDRWHEYEGIGTISIYKYTLHSKDKSKNFEIQLKDGHILPTSKEGIDSLVIINGKQYINISGILNYLDYNFRVYTDVEKGCNVIEILE